MKKKILNVAFVVAKALVSGINVFNAQKSEMLSGVALANVEALAMDEISKMGRWKRITDSLGCYLHHKCDENGDGYVCSTIGGITIIPQ